jgi:thioredoxin 1
LAGVFDTPIHTNDQSIDRVLSAGLPVVLVFLSGPAPVVLEASMQGLARANAGQMLVAKIQANENPVTTQRFRVELFPAVVTVRQGQVLSQAEAVGPVELEQHSAYLLGQGPRPARRTAPAGPDLSAKQVSHRNAARSQVSAAPIVVTDANFKQEVLGSGLPVLVDFWAPWCGPCRMTEPSVQRLAKERAGRLKVAKMNVDENPYTVQLYGIQSIPTMMLVRRGQIVDRWMGALSELALRSRVDSFLQSSRDDRQHE